MPGRRARAVRRRSTGAALSAALALVLGTAGCGVQLDEEPRPLAVDSVPFGLLEPDTPATDGSSVPLSSVPILEATIVYLVDNDGFLVEVRRELEGERTVEQALRSLLSDLTEAERDAGLTTAISSTTELRGVAGPEGGLVTIDLSDDVDVVPPDIVRVALAQLVYTATAFPGVDRVLFQVDGQAREVPTGEGQSTAEPLTRSDYRELLRPPTITTTRDGLVPGG